MTWFRQMVLARAKGNLRGTQMKLNALPEDEPDRQAKSSELAQQCERQKRFIKGFGRLKGR